MANEDHLWAFPGLHYFKDDAIDRSLFFGREREIRDLIQKIIAKNVIVFFGKSGDGKTSLINAGLMQRLRDLGYFPIRTRLFNVSKESSPIEALYKAIRDEAPKNQVKLSENWEKRTLWETFYDLRPTHENSLKPIVLILDQFEELFTLMASRSKEQLEFVEQFADLVRGRLPQKVRDRYHDELNKLEVGSEKASDIENILYGSAVPFVRIIISLREDYLAYVDNLGERIPKVYHNRYRLPSLSTDQARNAISKPPEQKVLKERAFKIDNQAVDAVIDFLTVESISSGMRQKVIGPPQLQILCRQLEEEMRKKRKKRISVADLGGEKGMRRLLSNYYYDMLKKIPLLRLLSGPKKLKGFLGLLRRLQPIHLPRLSVRHLCEDRLITPGGNRNTRNQEEIIREIGVSELDLKVLDEESRLLRRESRLAEAYYELSHDSLVPILQAAGKARRRVTLGLKIMITFIVIIAAFQWGLPYLRSSLTMNQLSSALNALEKDEISVAVFGKQLEQAKTVIADSLSLSKIRDELIAYFLQLRTNVERADSLLNLLTTEYSRETFIISQLSDTLQQRKILEIERKYYGILNTRVGDLSEDERLEQASTLLESAYVLFENHPKIVELRADIAGRLGDFEEQRRLLNELDRKGEIISDLREKLYSAIALEKPQGLVVKGDPSGGKSKIEFILKPNILLEGATIYINGNLLKGRKGYLEIPANVKQVTAEINATLHEDIKTSRTLKFRVDRAKPRLITPHIQYRYSVNENWIGMPSQAWLGNFWRLEANSSEGLQSCKLEFKNQAGSLFSRSDVEFSKSTDSFSIQGTTNQLRNVGKFSLFIQLTDSAGWQNRLALGDWETILDINPPVSDVVKQFSKIRTRGDYMAAWDGGQFPSHRYTSNIKNELGLSNHFQGIQRFSSSNYLVISGADRHEPMSHLFVVKMGSRNNQGNWRSNLTKTRTPANNDEIVATIRMDSTLWHAGGISILGDILAVPLYSRGDPPISRIVFYQVKSPEKPKLLNFSIDIVGGMASAVALTKIINDYYLVGIRYLNSKRPTLDFYLSKSRNIFDGFDEEKISWFASELKAVEGLEPNFDQYQCINFINQSDRKLFLIGIHNTSRTSPLIGGKNIVDLFEIVFPGRSLRMSNPEFAIPTIIKLASKVFECKDGQCNMDAAAGIYVDSSGILNIFSAPHWRSGNIIKFNSFRSDPDYDDPPITTIEQAWIDLYDGDNFDARCLSLLGRTISDIRDYESIYVESDFSFNDEASSARFQIPVGYIYRLYEDKNYKGDYKDLKGTGKIETVTDFKVLLFDNKISSSRFINLGSEDLAK